jgi:hypothetical protein
MRTLIVLPFLLAVSCCAHGPCIVPPAMETTEQHNIAVGIAATLAQLPAGGSLNTSFSSTVHTTYDKLADRDKSLYLFLIAIECYLKEGEVGQVVAGQMAQLVREEWASKEPSTEPPGTRDLRKVSTKNIDKRNPIVAPRIHEILKKLGQE